MMEFSLENESGLAIDAAWLEQCARVICEGEGRGRDCEVNILLCGDEEIRRYNLQYRGDNSVTDVLSFGYLEEPGGDIRAGVQPMVCDIIIDIKQVDRQKGFNTLEQELMEIFIHGLLHGFGYDHIRSRDRELMNEKERDYKQMMVGTPQRG
jgi:probable rRNA maturation factor